MGLIDTVVSTAKSLIGSTGAGVIGKLHPGGLVASLARDALEGLGAPRWTVSLVSGAINAYTGNYTGAAMDGLDILANIEAPPQRSAGAAVAREAATAGGREATDAPREAAPEESGGGWRASPAKPKAPGGKSAPAHETAGAPSGAPSKTKSASTAAKKDDGAGVSEKRKPESDGMKAAKDFNAKHADPESFMNAIRNGKIPEEILLSQGGLMVLQQRLADIQRMNALMTQMMKSMHEMEMEIVRNIRT